MNDDAPNMWLQADIVTPMAIRVAATLRIADHITQGLTTAPALAKATGTHPDALARLLNHLVTARVLARSPDPRPEDTASEVLRSGSTVSGGTGSVGPRERDNRDQDHYYLTLGGETLRDDHPDGLRTMLDTTGMIGRADLAFIHLEHSIRTGEPSFPQLYGRSFWDDARADPTRCAEYDTQMGVDVAGDAPNIEAGFDWGSLTHIMDVGGGNGTLLTAILNAHPHLRGTVFDQPDTVAHAQKTLTAAGLTHRADTIGGSFFDPLPKGPDAYLLSAIIHDWDDPSATAILRRCAEAATPHASVFIIEKIGPDGASLRTGMDLRVLIYMAGKERTTTQLATLATTAGLHLTETHPAGDLSILRFTTTQP
ncbi:methyltransferase [Acrocarpospora corrugata]|uniref:Methyltransferase n=1 Tax=Acrocarpospora corrugata TaxID=35763 RepID=A0A5M3VYC1_9ACTN|nr:methyltransferase [Acrocarpospora corrugata]GES01867.1 methyltransferase [Acrocarpospora corrugata]